MGKRKPIEAAVLVLAALSLWAGAALSAPGTAANFAGIAAALSSGDGAQALLLSDAALNQPGLAEADHNRLLLDHGLANHLLGDSEAALADITQVINARDLTAPEQARAYLERGLVLDGLNRLEDAIGDYGAVLRLIPDSSTALNNRANAFRRLGRADDARRDYLASLAADNPAPEYPYYGLGEIAESEGKRAQAISFYSRALAANPDYPLAAQRLAALGGAPVAAGIVTLRPPKEQLAEEGPVVLHPVVPRNTPAKFTAVAPATVRPADYSDRDEPGLRPALDNPGGQEVQLGAWRQEAEAAAGWNHAVKAAGGALSGFSPHIVTVDLPGKGRYFRLRVATPDGKSLCATLAARGLDCLPARD